MKRHVFLASVCLALAGGCTTLQTNDAEPRPLRDTIAAFRLEGRIAVRRAEESFSAHIEWRHDAQSDELILSGPLGQGLARLTSGGGTALLETTDQKRYASSDLDGLSEQLFGVRLPVSELGRWVLGRSITGGTVRHDAMGRIADLFEQGWAIEYLRYENETTDALPELLKASRSDIEVRLKIDSWSVSR